MMVNDEYKERRKKYIEEGWDYLDLAKLWKIEIPQECKDSSKPIADYLDKWYQHHMMYCVPYPSVCNCEITRVAEDLRIFLRSLGDEEKSNTFYAPMWRGMAEIEDDSELVKITIPIIGYMWD